MTRMTLLGTACLMMLPLAGVALGAASGTPKLRSGPNVGDTIPAFSGVDHNGKQQSFESLRGPNGLLLLFTRSADWCIYCKTNLAQLERKREQFEKQGIRMAAVTHDSKEILANFAGRTGIHYPLIGDAEAKIIRAFDVLNDTIPPTHERYGMPNPVEYLIDAKGVVTAKYFDEDYTKRFTAGNILVRELGADSGSPSTQKQTDHLTVTTSASDSIVHGGNRVALVLEVDLKPKMHVYSPEVKGYIPIEWKMDSANGLTFHDAGFPPSKLLHLPAIDEVVPVYEGRFRVLRDVLLGKPEQVEPLLNAEGQLVLKGTFRYQACDDKVCYLPQTVPVEWKFQWQAHDRTRVPEELQRVGRRPGAGR